MPGPRKITLQQAWDDDDRFVVFYCENRMANCHHRGETRLSPLIAKYGGHTRLDELPARCAACGSDQQVDVRSRRLKRDGGHPTLGDLVEDDW